MKFNLSDAVLKGTDDSNQYMDQVNSRLQLRFNSRLAKINSYKSCDADTFSGDVSKFTSDKYGFNSVVGGDGYTCLDVLMSFPRTANLYIEWLLFGEQYGIDTFDTDLWPYSVDEVLDMIITKD